jgi:hypothetical protein
VEGTGTTTYRVPSIKKSAPKRPLMARRIELEAQKDLSAAPLSFAQLTRLAPNIDPAWIEQMLARGQTVTIGSAAGGGGNPYTTPGGNVILSYAAAQDRGGIQGTLTHEFQHVRQVPYRTALNYLGGALSLARPFNYASPKAKLVEGATWAGEFVPNIVGGGYGNLSRPFSPGTGGRRLTDMPSYLQPFFRGFLR